jgi:ferredoxin
MPEASPKRFKVILDREACIGAAACMAVQPRRWKMMDDGKVDLLGSKRSPDGRRQELHFTAEELEDFKLAAESCPVNAIYIEDEDGKKVV